MDRSFLTDNPKLVDEIVCEVKSQGVFDQFRRNCIADVDTKPAYQNLRQRVENIVSNFLSDQVWRPDLNKNQLREKLRKHITEAGFLETGVERIVDQVVNPKINSVFLPKIEDISYKYLGIEKPKPSNDQTSFKTEPLANEDIKQPINLPPDFDDLEAVSPDSSGSKKSFKDSTENLDTSIDPDSIKTELNDSGDKVDDDFESPAFEPLKGSLLNESDSINGEEDSKLSDISGLTSQDSVKSEQNGEQNCEQPIAIPEPEIKAPTIEVIEQPAVTQSQQVIPENINQDSVLSQVSSNSHLSIVTDSNNKSSEVDICEEAQMPKFSENSFNNPVVDDSERKPLMTVFDIKQDEIKFEGTERRSSLHDLSDDLKVEEDIVMEQLPEPEPPADSVGDESLMKTESSSSCMDPIISETKDLSLKDDGRSSEIEFKDKEFKFEEPVVSADTTDASVGVSSSQTANDRHKSKDLKGERKSDSRSEHKSYRRDKDKSSHHSRDRHKDGKHSSSSSSKHSSSSSSSRKEHRSESRETNKTTSSDHRRDESSKSTDRSSGKSQSSSSRDKDSNYKSSRSHEDKDKNRSRHDRSSNKSRTHHRDDKKRQSQDDDENDKRKPGQESETKSKANDDHGVHHEKPFERRRSTDRDSDDGTMERGKPTSTTRPVASVNSSAITNSASSSSFSSTTSSCTDEYEKRGTSDIQKIAADSNVHTSSTDSDDGFVPTSTPVVVDDILIRSDINLEMLMETNSMETTDETSPIMSMMQQSLSDDAEMKLKKPKVASNIFEARKLMKVRKQMERDKKKRLEKLLVHSKQVLVGCNNVDEQGVELEFSVMNSSAPSISSPIKSKEVAFEGHQVPAPVNEKRNSGEFIIDMNEMKEMEKQMKKKRAEKQPPAPKFVHKFDEILSQIDKPRKRDSKGNQSPISPGHEKSPKYSTGSQERPKPSEPMPRKYAREQSKETLGVDSKKPATITSPPIQQRDEKRTEKAAPVRPQDGSKSRKNSSSSKSPPTPHSPTKMEHKIAKLNRMPEKATKSSSAPGAASSSKHEKVVTPTKQKEIKIDGTPKTTLRPEDIPKVTADTSTKSNIDLVDENEPDFFGFSECVALLDFAQIKQILSSKSQNRTLHLLNYDKSMSDIFSQYSTNIIDVTGSVEQCATNDKLPGPDKSAGVAGSQTKGTRKSTTSKNGVRATPQSQHKLFIENNQFADKSDVKQISRKRRTSNVAHGSAAKIVRLVDSKVSGDEAEETSPTPSEQSKENQIVQQIKRHNRSTDISCTSNEIDQQPGEKSEPTKSNPNQRYASDDLYKPRPILSRSRRRGIENGET